MHNSIPALPRSLSDIHAPALCLTREPHLLAVRKAVLPHAHWSVDNGTVGMPAGTCMIYPPDSCWAFSVYWLLLLLLTYLASLHKLLYLLLVTGAFFSKVFGLFLLFARLGIDSMTLQAQ